MKSYYPTRQATYVKRNIQARSWNHCCSGKVICITYSECVSVALGIQPAQRMSRITLSTEVYLPLSYFFPLYLINDTIFGGGDLWNIKYIIRSSCKVPVILVRLYWNLNFLDRFSKNPQISNFVIIRQVGAELFRTEGRTWRS